MKQDNPLFIFVVVQSGKGISEMKPATKEDEA